MKKLKYLLGGKSPLSVALVFLFILLSLNSIYNSIYAGFGGAFPHTTFLNTPDDLFGDFFKGIFSFAKNSSDIHDFENLPDYLKNYFLDNPYKSDLNSLKMGWLTNLHGPPLVMAFSLLNIYLFEFINPVYIYCFWVGLGVFLAAKLIYLICRDRVDRYYFMLIMAASYPTIYVLSRGHIYSLYLALSVFYFLLYLNKKNFYLALLCLAIGVNIRFNCAIFILMLFPLVKNLKFKISYFVILSLLIFFINYAFVTHFYSTYTFDNFSQAVKNYHRLYVVAENGIAYGSSMFGVLKVIFGYKKFLEVIPYFFCTCILLRVLYLRKKNLFSDYLYIFVLCCMFALSIQVFADYYLLVFFAPIFLLYMQNTNLNFFKIASTADLLTFFSTILLLAPKNYFIENISIQLFINPLTMAFAALYASFYNREIDK